MISRGRNPHLRVTCPFDGKAGGEDDRMKMEWGGHGGTIDMGDDR